MQVLMRKSVLFASFCEGGSDLGEGDWEVIAYTFHDIFCIIFSAIQCVFMNFAAKVQKTSPTRVVTEKLPSSCTQEPWTIGG